MLLKFEKKNLIIIEQKLEIDTSQKIETQKALQYIKRYWTLHIKEIKL